MEEAHGTSENSDAAFYRWLKERADTVTEKREQPRLYLPIPGRISYEAPTEATESNRGVCIIDLG